MIITYGIIGLTVVISFYAWNNPDVMSKLIMNPYTVNRRQEYYRFITSGLIHKDHMHLLFNMISLYFFGTYTEQLFGIVFQELGSLYFVALYLLAVIVSEVPSYFKNRSNPAYNTLGASGGVSAIIFAFILFLPTERICLFFAICLPGFILGGLYLLYSYFQARRDAYDGINHDAHLYGSLFGIIFCAVLYPASLPLFIQQLANWKLELF